MLLLLLVPVQDSSQPVMTADEIVRRLEQLDAALRVVESEGRELEEKIRKGISAASVSRASKTAARLLRQCSQPAVLCAVLLIISKLMSSRAAICVEIDQ